MATITQMIKHDERFMQRALALAWRAEGRVEPDPMVGCVIVKGARVIGEGYHRRFGADHAEVAALRRCRQSPRGATAYVTLEPCCHVGKTPPCTDALIAAGIAEVVFPFDDPFPQVRGKGSRLLRKAGIAVRTGLCMAEAADLVAPFLTFTCRRRPYVIAKWAQSLDGRLVAPPGRSTWISSEPSRRLVHRLRARVDAIVVGVETVLADDPLLTARDVPILRTALRIVLDSHLRTPTSAQLAQTAQAAPTVIATSASAAATKKADRLRRLSVEILPCRTTNGRVAAPDLLRQLAKRGVTNVLIEGGPTVLNSMFEGKLVDEARVFVAPFAFGGPRGGQVVSNAAPYRSELTASGSDAYFRLRLGPPPGVPAISR